MVSGGTAARDEIGLRAARAGRETLIAFGADPSGRSRLLAAFHGLEPGPRCDDARHAKTPDH